MIRSNNANRICRIGSLLVLAVPGIALAVMSVHATDMAIGISMAILLPAVMIGYQRRFRMTLRVMLVLLGIGCLSLGYLANKASQQRAAVKAILQAGGRVRYEKVPENNRDPTLTERLLYPVLGDDWFYDVRAVTLYGDGCCDETLKHVVALPNVEDLSLWPSSVPPTNGTIIGNSTPSGAGVTDDGLSSLRTMRNLRSISLDGNRFSDRGLEYLKECPNLIRAQVDYSQNSKVTKDAYHSLMGTIHSRPVPVTTE